MLLTIKSLSNNLLHTPLGNLTPAQSVSQNVTADRIERMALELSNLKSKGLAAITVSHDPAVDNDFEAESKATFDSGSQTGNGGVQSIPHGLGIVPTKVVVSLVGGPPAYTQPTITEGVHDATNIKVTCTTSWKWRAVAWK